jgi:hypothetical protein
VYIRPAWARKRDEEEMEIPKDQPRYLPVPDLEAERKDLSAKNLAKIRA